MRYSFSEKGDIPLKKGEWKGWQRYTLLLSLIFPSKFSGDTDMFDALGLGYLVTYYTLPLRDLPKF